MVKLLFKKPDWRIGFKKSILMCIALVGMGLMSQVGAQVTMPNTNGDCADGDCFEFIDFATVDDPAGGSIPNYFEGEAQDNGCNTIIGAQAEYMGADATGADISSGLLRANQQGASTDTWQVTFDEPLENPVLDINALMTGSFTLIKDCEGNEITTGVVVGTQTPTYTTGQGWTGTSNYRIQLIGEYSCVILEVAVPGNDAYTFTFGTCLGANPPPPCVDCGMNENLEYLNLVRTSGSGVGMTADVELDNVVYGTAEVLESSLTIAEDLRGTAFGAFANGDASDETFLMRIDLCEAISIQQLEVKGLETESQVWVGTSLDASMNPTGFDLANCGGTDITMFEDDTNKSMVTNTSSRCSNQGNGKYLVSGGAVSTLYFRYTNPAGGCKFDKATFRIATCVGDGSDAVPTCPLTEVTLTTDTDAIDSGMEPSGSETDTYVLDANGNYFSQTCTQIQNEVENMIALTPVKVSPCAEIVDEVDCTFCEPTPPCTDCAENNSYEYVDLRNFDDATGTADIYLNNVVVGTASVEGTTNVIKEDLNGKRFGALALGRNETESLTLKLEFCEALSIQQIDILGLEGESQVWVGTAFDGTNVTGGTIDECGTATDAGMIVDGTSNTVINNARCSNQGDGNYSFSESSVSVLYFKYENVAGSCQFDKTTYRIGVCSPDLGESTPMCSLEVFESTVTLADGSEETQLLVKGEDGKYYDYSDINGATAEEDELDEVAVSPCATLIDVCATATAEDTKGICDACFTCPEFTGVLTCDPERPVYGQPFEISVDGLTDMAETGNNEQDFGILFVAFPGTTPPADPYDVTGAIVLGTVPFADLTNGNSTATLDDAIFDAATFGMDYTLVAILTPAPTTEVTCRPAVISTASKEVIPTMGQWALFILALLMSSLAVVRIRQEKNHEVKELA